MNNKDKIYIVIFNILLYAITSLFMYDFYKALSGLIANNFYEAHIMLTIILSYLLPVFYYLFFFYDKYCKRQSNKVRFIFDIIFIIYCLYNIISIFSHINIYISNSNLGVYDSMPSLFLSFPFDMLVVNCLILFISIISLVNIFKPNEKISNIRNVFSEYGFISLKKYEYALISILAILCFVFFGDFLNSFKAIDNLFYDPKYLYLMLWVLIVPLSTITYFVLKLDRYFSTKKSSIIYQATFISIHTIFILLLVIFELTSPNFITYIGKPIFAIAFSVSLPIEMIVLLALSGLNIIFSIAKILSILFKRNIPKQSIDSI